MSRAPDLWKRLRACVRNGEEITARELTVQLGYRKGAQTDELLERLHRAILREVAR